MTCRRFDTALVAVAALLTVCGVLTAAGALPTGWFALALAAATGVAARLPAPRTKRGRTPPRRKPTPILPTTVPAGFHQQL